MEEITCPYYKKGGHMIFCPISCNKCVKLTKKKLEKYVDEIMIDLNWDGGFD